MFVYDAAKLRCFLQFHQCRFQGGYTSKRFECGKLHPWLLENREDPSMLRGDFLGYFGETYSEQ